MTDDGLLTDIMDWTRIYRNEGKLFGDERKYFKALCREATDRKLLSKKELFLDRGNHDG